MKRYNGISAIPVISTSNLGSYRDKTSRVVVTGKGAAVSTGKAEARIYLHQFLPTNELSVARTYQTLYRAFNPQRRISSRNL